MDTLYTMIQYYNTCTQYDTNYEIIEYILKNIDIINTLSISKIADETFVSKSTITRFVRKFGYKDFDDFRLSIHKFYHNNWNSSFRLNNNQLKTLKDEPELFFDEYSQSICDAIEDMKNIFDYRKVDFLIDEMMSKKCAIFAYNQPLQCAKEIQNDFLIKNRIIYVGETFEKQLNLAQSLTNQDLAIIFSNYGNYFNEHSQIIDTLTRQQVPIILITLNYHSPQSLIFKDIIYLSSKPFSAVGGYPMKLFTEYLIRRFIVKYNLSF